MFTLSLFSGCESVPLEFRPGDPSSSPCFLLGLRGCRGGRLCLQRLWDELKDFSHCRHGCFFSICNGRMHNVF
ncbi:hypothetical protein EYF80_004304 [Liparis tanakae]|uniref:Uncharacterized protein n=1 Tax=Liparis tanakae TaxID=230148 RepID=A0A4Z2J762_9TELE|nr:hypothetical protein EYF80_004304 [Liparis tanakae]